MNVLGVIFDSKLQWSNQVANSVRKANSALHAINMGAHSLENVKVHIENDYQYIPGPSVNLCFYLHLKGLTLMIYVCKPNFLIDMLRLTPA